MPVYGPVDTQAQWRECKPDPQTNSPGEMALHSATHPTINSICLITTQLNQTTEERIALTISTHRQEQELLKAGWVEGFDKPPRTQAVST